MQAAACWTSDGASPFSVSPLPHCFGPLLTAPPPPGELTMEWNITKPTHPEQIRTGLRRSGILLHRPCWSSAISAPPLPIVCHPGAAPPATPVEQGRRAWCLLLGHDLVLFSDVGMNWFCSEVVFSVICLVLWAKSCGKRPHAAEDGRRCRPLNFGGRLFAVICSGRIGFVMFHSIMSSPWGVSKGPKQCGRG
jgi:hypothetical protein